MSKITRDELDSVVNSTPYKQRIGMYSQVIEWLEAEYKISNILELRAAITKGLILSRNDEGYYKEYQKK